MFSFITGNHTPCSASNFRFLSPFAAKRGFSPRKLRINLLIYSKEERNSPVLFELFTIREEIKEGSEVDNGGGGGFAVVGCKMRREKEKASRVKY